MSCDSGSDQEKTMLTQINRIGSAGTCRRAGRALRGQATEALVRLPTNVRRQSLMVCGRVIARSVTAAFVKMDLEQTAVAVILIPPVFQFDPSRLSRTL